MMISIISSLSYSSYGPGYCRVTQILEPLKVAWAVTISLGQRLSRLGSDYLIPQ